MANKPYKCRSCTRRFKTKDQLNAHRDLTHGALNVQAQQSPPPPIIRDAGQCPHCDRTFGGAHGLTQHLGRDLDCKAMHEASINAETSSLSSATQPTVSNRGDRSLDQDENNIIAQVAEGSVTQDIPQLGDTVGQSDDDDNDSMTESDSSDATSDGESTEGDSETEGGDEDAEDDLPADEPYPNPPSQSINDELADNEVELDESTDQYGNRVYMSGTQATRPESRFTECRTGTTSISRRWAIGKPGGF
ncbi:C2H2 zinc finger [Ceratobasidium sp. AG-Ba]|nr:C2H2 zinc finger [Ceratobasidium sp. AG-Ba]